MDATWALRSSVLVRCLSVHRGSLTLSERLTRGTPLATTLATDWLAPAWEVDRGCEGPGESSESVRPRMAATWFVRSMSMSSASLELAASDSAAASASFPSCADRLTSSGVYIQCCDCRFWKQTASRDVVMANTCSTGAVEGRGDKSPAPAYSAVGARALTQHQVMVVWGVQAPAGPLWPPLRDTGGTASPALLRHPPATPLCIPCMHSRIFGALLQSRMNCGNASVHDNGPGPFKAQLGMIQVGGRTGRTHGRTA